MVEDTKAGEGKVPPTKDVPTVAQLHYEPLAENPYTLTSDDQRQAERRRFFSKG